MQLDGVGKLASKRGSQRATSGQGGLVARKMRKEMPEMPWGWSWEGAGADGGLQPVDGPQVLDGRDGPWDILPYVCSQVEVGRYLGNGPL